jgi:hypothetical protein
MGTQGIANVSQRNLEIQGAEQWVYRGERNVAQQTEHDELFDSIRKGKPINNGPYMSKSTLMAIMGRMATYTGQAVTWEQALQSREKLSPDRYDWNAKPPESSVAIPGVTKLA